MSDLIFLAVVVGFFALAVGLLRACEHIIGPDPVSSTSPTSSMSTSGTTTTSGVRADRRTATESTEVTA